MSLFESFEPADLEIWKKRALDGMRGSSLDTLRWSDDPALVSDPYYDAQHLAAIPTTHLGKHRTNNDWVLIEKLQQSDDTNDFALEALNFGATGILVESTHLDVSKIDKILPEHCWLGVRIGEDALKATSHFLAFLQSRNVDSDAFHGLITSSRVHSDPLSAHHFLPDTTTLAAISKLTEQFPNLKTIDLRCDLLHNQGATLTDELACALAMAQSITERLMLAGMEVSMVAKKLHISVAVGTDFYHEIAKIRALRLLLFKMFAAYGAKVALADFFITGITSDLSQSVLDSETNYLRKSTQAMSCVLGGVDGLMITPFDTSYFDSFNRRICRNVGNILREEASLHAVADPLSGSYFMESLTHRMAEKSWNKFSKIVSDGGWADFVEKGELKKALHASFSRVKEDIKARKKILVGVNDYPNPKVNFVQPKEHQLSGYAADFEKLHEVVHNYNQQTIEPLAWQPVFVGANGAFQSARLNFTANFLGCAGILAKNALPIVESVAAGNTPIIVLCGSDEDYEQLEEAAVKEVASRCTLLCVAGQPANVSDALSSWGVEIFIHRKSPMYATLLQVLACLNIKIPS